MEFLTARHSNSNNKYQALKVYKGQCRKSEEQRQGMRLVHQELVEKDFMKRLVDCDEETQDFIKSHPTTDSVNMSPASGRADPNIS